MLQRLTDVLNGQESNYMLPFYWQHGDHHKTIPEEVERIYQSGAKAFCVESRPHKDFCGESWWQDMDVILAEAEKRDMKVWILDDDHFPTGHAAGHIEKYHPEHGRWQLVEHHVDVVGPLKDAMLLVKKKEEEDQFIGAYAYLRTGEGEDLKAEPICLTGQIQGNFLHVSLPEGIWRIFFYYKSRKGMELKNYMDMLTEEGVKVLIDAVYEPHYAHYGKYFGNTIAGFFSDEPQLGNTWFTSHTMDYGWYNRRVGMPGLALPWNEALLKMMTETLGFDAEGHLAALWFDLGEVTAKVRYAYMDALTKRYRDCFTRQLGDWCENHGVQYIGHIIEDMNAHARLGCSAGHYFRALDGQHMSGIDIVLHQLMPGMSDYIHTMSASGNNADPEFFDYILAKLASSYAHIGTQMEGRAMCEVFGAYGWAEGTPVMKWLLDYLLVRGVNHFVPHAFSPAFPDPDCPPHFGANGVDPQFEGFNKLMNYGNQAAHLLFGGVHQADVAILYHGEAEWMNRDGEMMLMQVPAKMLYDAHVDFDILPADCFTGAAHSRIYPAEADNGRLRVGKETYRCLIVPEAKVLPEKLVKELEKLKAAGVPVLQLGMDVEVSGLLSAVQELFVPDIQVKGTYPKLRCCHYREEQAEIYMFANESITEGVETEVQLREMHETEGILLDILNDETGKIQIKDGCLDLTLAPYQSVLLVIEKDTLRELPEKKNWIREKAADLTFRIETAPYTDMENYQEYAKEVPSKALFSLTGADQIPEFSGKIRYTASFEAAELPRKDSLAIDLGEVGQTAHLWCNGKDLGVRLCPPYRYELTDALRPGVNELVIEVSNTLANAVQDSFSTYMAIPASGLLGEICWMKENRD